MKIRGLLKKWEMIAVVFMSSILTVASSPQNNKISWSVFNSGFGFSKNSNSGITAVAGQNFTGTDTSSNTEITSGFLAGFSPVLTDVSNNNNGGSIPEKFELSQNYPNPFNPTTTIRYSLPEAASVRLDIYNILGQRISTLVNEEQKAGNYQVRFQTPGLSSGVYLYRLQAGNHVMVRKMLFMK